MLLWLGKERSDDFADILGPEVFRAMLTAMERDQFNEKRSNRLREFMLDDQELIADLTASADIEVIKDLTRALQLSPVFDDMDKRSLLARIVKTPSRRPVARQRRADQAGIRAASSPGKAWNAASRIHGTGAEEDSRPTPRKSPSPAATATCAKITNTRPRRKCRKCSCAARRNWKPQLTRARGTDFANARTDVVSIGTVVQATDLDSNQSETFTILGAWDFDADKGIISYLTPVGQALLNNKVGDEVEFEVHGARHRHRIEKIEAFKQAESTEPPAPSPA